MNYWLLKSEPDSWSWDDQVKKKRTNWDGVRNYQATKYLRAMQTGDHAFFYHSNDGKEIVGIVRIVREAYPDPQDKTGKFVMVDIETVKALPRAVTLGEIKQDANLKEMALVKQARLSVQPVTPTEAKRILALAHSVLNETRVVR